MAKEGFVVVYFGEFGVMNIEPKHNPRDGLGARNPKT